MVYTPQRAAALITYHKILSTGVDMLVGIVVILTASETCNGELVPDFFNKKI